MSEARAGRTASLARTLALFERVAVAPGRLALWIGVSWFGLCLVYAQAVGWFEQATRAGLPVWQSDHFALSLIFSLLFAYLPAAIVYRLRGAVSDLRALRPALRCGDAEFAARQRAFTHFDRRTLTLLTLAGLGLGLCLPFLDSFWRLGQRPPLGDRRAARPGTGRAPPYRGGEARRARSDPERRAKGQPCAAGRSGRSAPRRRT